MRRALLYVLGAVLVVAIVAMAWYTRQAELPATHQVRAGDTEERLAARYGVPFDEIVDANPEALGDGTLDVGEKLNVPRAPATRTDVAIAYAAGLAAELVGVVIAVWLAMAGGVVARVVRRQVAGIAIVLATVSYVATQVAAAIQPALTAGFLFDAFQDGFFWAALFVLLAQVLRMRDAAPEPAGVPGEEPAAGAPPGGAA